MKTLNTTIKILILKSVSKLHRFQKDYDLIIEDIALHTISKKTLLNTSDLKQPRWRDIGYG